MSGKLIGSFNVLRHACETNFFDGLSTFRSFAHDLFVRVTHPTAFSGNVSSTSVCIATIKPTMEMSHLSHPATEIAHANGKYVYQKPLPPRNTTLSEKAEFHFS